MDFSTLGGNLLGTVPICCNVGVYLIDSCK